MTPLLLATLLLTPLTPRQQADRPPGPPGNAGTRAVERVTIGPPIRVDLGGSSASNETTISASPANPLEIVAGWNDYREGSSRNGVGLSLDGGATWSDFLLRPPLAFQANVEGDPMTCADPRTGTLWAGGISFGPSAIFCARKDPGSATFEPVVVINSSGFIDKGWMAAGPGPVDPANTTSVYVAFNFGVQGSTDLGDSWSPLVPLTSGLGYLPRVGPQGELYVTYWDFGTEVLLQRSFDGGQTFGPAIVVATRMDTWGIDATRVPGEARVASLNAMAVDPRDGQLFLVYPDTTSVEPNGSDLDLYFTRSEDQGLSWGTPAVIVDDTTALPGDQFFPWLEIDRTGRLHLLFFDTSAVPQDDDDPFALVDAVYASSEDDGQTWTRAVLTATPFSTEDDGFGGGFIGDYLGMSTAAGRTLPLYPDTRNGRADVFTHIIMRP